jgi:hypothetical protein
MGATYNIEKNYPKTVFYITKELGHKKILFNRETINIISNFIAGS